MTDSSGRSPPRMARLISKRTSANTCGQQADQLQDPASVVRPTTRSDQYPDLDERPQSTTTDQSSSHGVVSVVVAEMSVVLGYHLLRSTSYRR